MLLVYDTYIFTYIQYIYTVHVGNSYVNIDWNGKILYLFTRLIDVCN